jgi:DNA adenine methylase
MVDGPLKWHGGKAYLASKIVALMPNHLHYVEPYAGGLSVLLAKNPEGVSEVVNDLNGVLMNFWAALANTQSFAAFQRWAQATPFSERCWELSAESEYVPQQDQIDASAAVAFFVRCRQSMAGRMKDFAPLSRTRVRRGMNEQASAWLTTVEGLPAVHERLKRVVILNRDALDVIRQQDGEQTLFYLDPPYLHSTRATTGEYQHEMTEEQHQVLLATLAALDGKFMLSGYRSELYDDAARIYGWHRVDFDLPNNASSKKSKDRKTECVWTNFTPGPAA